MAIKSPRKISRQDAIARVIALEGMIHELINDCDISGLSFAAEALDKLTIASLDKVYTAVCEKD